MKPIDTFYNRLHHALSYRNMKPVELHEKTNISESLISKYLSGNAVARQRKLSILADALDINEVWLMGYDVPMEKKNQIKKNNNLYNDNSTDKLYIEEIKQCYGVNSIDLLENYKKLNNIGKEKANDFVQDLTDVPKYVERKNESQEA